MQKEIKFLLFAFLALSLLAEANAQEELNYNSRLEQLSQQYPNAMLQVKAGITPASTLYSFDIFLEKFSNLENARLEKVAEIIALRDSPQVAQIALNHYITYSKKLETEIDPEQAQQQAEDSVAIYNELKAVENTLSEEQKRALIEPIKKQEINLQTSAQIATTFKTLCMELSNKDPDKFYRSCRPESNAPQWKEKLYNEREQLQQAQTVQLLEKVTLCFQDAGNCNCDGLEITDYHEKCRALSSKASECRIQHNDACAQVEQLTTEMKEQTAPNLLNTLKTKEIELEKAKLKVVTPSACLILDSSSENYDDECLKLQIEEKLPGECKYSVENTLSEIQARADCAEALFKLDKPTKCAEVDTAQECARIVFEETVPECAKVGITGENLYDSKKCITVVKAIEAQSAEVELYIDPTCKSLDYSQKLDCYEKQLETIRKESEITPITEERTEETPARNQEDSVAIVNEEAQIETRTETQRQTETTTAGQQTNVKSTTQVSRYAAIVTGNSIFAAEDNHQSKTNNRFIEFYFSN